MVSTIIEKKVDYFRNLDWEKINTPIKVKELDELLKLTKYDVNKSNYLIQGFSQGFSIGYQGKTNRRDTSDNLPLKDLGNKTDLWNKVMKEVKLNRYAGPFSFEDLPVKENFIQSPIGLVPKAGGQTRLIFHLSYDFKNGNSSVNGNTPPELCRVKYNDLDHAINAAIKLLKKHGKRTLFFSKTDAKSAFRLVPVLVSHRCWLVMKAIGPKTGETKFFIDLCLPFGASISCAVFQAFSDALTHITEYLLQLDDDITNYLDDFLFIAISTEICNNMLTTFTGICSRIGCPLSDDKTEWATVCIIFLGTLLDGQGHCLCIPEEKKIKALNQLQAVTAKRSVTIKQIQSLTGILNFLN